MKPARPLGSPSLLLASLAFFGAIAPGVGEDQGTPIRVLVSSKAGWYRHPEIPRTNGWLVRLGQKRGYVVDVTETPEDLSPERLAEYRVLVINNANELGKVLGEEQRRAVADWFKKGNGIVGLHAALVHQVGWPWLN